MKLYLVSESKSDYETDRVFRRYRGIAKEDDSGRLGIDFIYSLSEKYGLVLVRGKELKKR